MLLQVLLACRCGGSNALHLLCASQHIASRGSLVSASTAHAAGSLDKTMQERPEVTLLRCPPEMPRMSSLPTIVSAQISKSCKAVGQPPSAPDGLEGAGASKFTAQDGQQSYGGARQEAMRLALYKQLFSCSRSASMAPDVLPVSFRSSGAAPPAGLPGEAHQQAQQQAQQQAHQQAQHIVSHHRVPPTSHSGCLQPGPGAVQQLSTFCWSVISCCEQADQLSGSRAHPFLICCAAVNLWSAALAHGQNFTTPSMWQHSKPGRLPALPCLTLRNASMSGSGGRPISASRRRCSRMTASRAPPPWHLQALNC